MDKKPWFTNKGQIFQTALSVIGTALSATGVLIAAHKAWPEMRSGTIFSSGAMLFYLLISVFIVSALALIRPIKKSLDPDSEPTNLLESLGTDVYLLTGYEAFVMKHLVAKGGSMTGRQLYDRMLDWGMPVVTLGDQNEIIATFERIAHKTTLLKKEPDSDVWILRKQVS